MLLPPPSHVNMHMARTALTVFVASPFSSSLVVVGLAGTAFQCQLVGVLGSHVVRVCQGALVLAVCRGQCWVRVSSVPPFTMARRTAHGGQRQGEGAMVARDGTTGPPAPTYSASDTAGLAMTVPDSSARHPLRLRTTSPKTRTVPRIRTSVISFCRLHANRFGVRGKGDAIR